jgi:hypothetical protein
MKKKVRIMSNLKLLIIKGNRVEKKKMKLKKKERKNLKKRSKSRRKKENSMKVTDQIH